MSYEACAPAKVQPLEMPASVFALAVKMATSGLSPDHGRQGVELLTAWWNASAESPHQGAYAFSLYVRYGEHWLAGDPEEHWVHRDTWANHLKPLAEATCCGGRVVLVFFRRSEDDDQNGFCAKAVDGSHGFSGARFDGLAGDEILLRFAIEALTLAPERFPDVWAEITAWCS